MMTIIMMDVSDRTLGGIIGAIIFSAMIFFSSIVYGDISNYDWISWLVYSLVQLVVGGIGYGIGCIFGGIGRSSLVCGP
jgi:hypothetical protein